MNIRNIFIALVVSITTFACAPAEIFEVTYEYDAYNNQSSHTITLSLYNNKEQKISKITLKPGETSQNLYREIYSKHVCIVNFDLTVELDYQKLPEDLRSSKYNILYNSNGGNYEFSQIDSHSYLSTYTFTDADYQFALENGTKLEL